MGNGAPRPIADNQAQIAHPAADKQVQIALPLLLAPPPGQKVEIVRPPPENEPPAKIARPLPKQPADVAPTETLGYTDAVAYIAVASSLVEKILEQGYVASKRQQVPCSFTVQDALKAFSTHHKDDDVSVLQVRKTDKKIDRRLGRIECKVLPKEYLVAGFRPGRQISDYTTAPCPLCGVTLGPALSHERGRVGVFRFYKGAYMVTPCEACKSSGMLAKREERLNQGRPKTLFHQTSTEYAAKIKAEGILVRSGAAHHGGRGIYFAETARQTEWKCNHGGVVLKCEVRLGKTKEVDRELEPADRQKITFADLFQEGYDSMVLRRGICKKPGPGFGKPCGDEWIAYSWDQVTVLGEVPRDRVPDENNPGQYVVQPWERRQGQGQV